MAQSLFSFFRQEGKDSISFIYTERVKIIGSTINPSFYTIFQNFKKKKTCKSYFNQMLYGQNNQKDFIAVKT